MRKFVIMFSVLILFATLLFILLFNYKDNTSIEKVYTVRSSYSYLSDDKTNLLLKIYSNRKNSLLAYADKANVTMHDRSEDNVISVVVKETNLGPSTFYNDELFYEYNINVELEISSLYIDECYLTLKYDNKAYVMNIGSLDINRKKDNYKLLKVTNLYGVSSGSDPSLYGVVLTINNNSDYNMKINNIKIGQGKIVLLDNENVVEVNDSTAIEDYNYKNTNIEGFLSLPKKESETFILPIKNDSDLYLFNCYMLFEINGEEYLISNFNYINSNDLSGLEKYIISGIVYEL